MCRTFLEQENQINLIVADNLGSKIIDGVNIYDVGIKKKAGRMHRIFTTPKAIYKEALKIDSDIFHLHDPELMPLAIKLKKINKKVVFDFHEDIFSQFVEKPYLNKLSNYIIASFCSAYQKTVCRKVDAVITATDYITSKLKNYNPFTITIFNYPKFDEFKNIKQKLRRNNELCYIGGLTSARGAKEMIQALEFVKTPLRLNLAWDISEHDLYKKLQLMAGWKRVVDHKFCDRKKVIKILEQSCIGLLLLLPKKNYLHSMPVKMFEYMLAGLPIVASNNSTWEKIIKKYNCGITVDPLNPSEVANCISGLLKTPDTIKKLGYNGRKAAREKFNWDSEKSKLLSIYNKILYK